MVRLENVTKVAESFVESALSRSATSSTISPFDKIVTSELSREGRLIYREHFYTPRHDFSVTMSSAFMATLRAISRSRAAPASSHRFRLSPDSVRGMYTAKIRFHQVCVCPRDA